jgi:hypothetical protein
MKRLEAQLWTPNCLPLACMTPAFISKIVELATRAAYLTSEQAGRTRGGKSFLSASLSQLQPHR